MALLKRVAAASVLLAACGLGGAPGGGSENLPVSGGGPYVKLSSDSDTPAEEPYVIVQNTADLEDPSALAARAGGYDVWFTRRPADATTSEIWYAHLPSIRDKPDVGPELALAASEAWEAGSVQAPSVVDLGADRRVMYYQAGTDDAPVVGHARSDDGGRTWVREGLVLEGAMDPAALVIGPRTLLYFGLPEGRGIGLAEASDGGAFLVAPDPVIVPRDTDPGAFDRVWIGEPEAVGGITPANRLHIGIFYVGRATSITFAIGHAVSDDGRIFMRFFNGAAILEASGAGDRGPGAVLSPDQGVLFFAERRAARSVIAVATSP